MSEENQHKEARGNGITGMGVAIGAAVGAGLGAAFDNVAVGVAVGVALGAAISQTVPTGSTGRKDSKRSEHHDDLT